MVISNNPYFDINAYDREVSVLILKNRVRNAREEKGLTQEELAARVGCSRNTIVSLENEIYSPTGYLCAILCKELEKQFDELFWLSEEKSTRELQNIATMLRDARKEREMTQLEFATLIGSTQAAINYWENGKRIPRADKLKKIADKLGIPAEELLAASHQEI